MMRIRRTHGVFGGLLVALLGIWGGIIPFVGPYFHYAYTPGVTWTYNTGRLWLEILPGAGAFLGGLMMMWAGSRHVALFGSLLAILSGAWFALGNVLAPLWTTANPAGVPASAGTVMRAVEQVGFFTGLGIAIVLLSALVAGRVTAVPRLPVAGQPTTGRPTTGQSSMGHPTMPIPARRRPSDEDETQAIG